MEREAPQVGKALLSIRFLFRLSGPGCPPPDIAPNITHFGSRIWMFKLHCKYCSYLSQS